jgi:hypothetical protein
MLVQSRCSTTARAASGNTAAASGNTAAAGAAAPSPETAWAAPQADAPRDPAPSECGTSRLISPLISPRSRRPPSRPPCAAATPGYQATGRQRRGPSPAARAVPPPTFSSQPSCGVSPQPLTRCTAPLAGTAARSRPTAASRASSAGASRRRLAAAAVAFKFEFTSLWVAAHQKAKLDQPAETRPGQSRGEYCSDYSFTPS